VGEREKPNAVEADLLTWSRFDDAAPTHPKAREAGNEAWGLWCAAVMYCNRYLTDGHITLRALARDCLPEKIPEAKAKKLAERLVDAKVTPDGKGLLVETDAGYLVHDFLVLNQSKADVESKRKADRDRKRIPGGIRTESERNPTGRQPEGDGNPGGVAVDSGGASRAYAGAGAGARSPFPSVPDRTLPASTDPSGLQSCPRDLRLTDDQRATLETSMVPVWAIDISTQRFVTKAVADPSDKRTLVHWLKCLAIAVSGDWNGPNRPTKPAESADGKRVFELPKGVKFGTDGL